MGYSIFDVVKDHITNNVQKSDKDIINNRIQICNTCDTLTKPFRICASCGCQVDAKVRYEKSTCPLGKW